MKIIPTRLKRRHKERMAARKALLTASALSAAMTSVCHGVPTTPSSEESAQLAYKWYQTSRNEREGDQPLD